MATEDETPNDGSDTTTEPKSASEGTSTSPRASSPGSSSPSAAGSAGARLAAQKAAKAAQKAQKKAQRETESGVTTTGPRAEPEKSAEEVLRETALGTAATKAAEWTGRNRVFAYGAVSLVAVSLVAVLGYQQYASSQAAAAGALLETAVETANAEIRSESAAPAEGDEDALHFENRTARAEASLEAYRAVLSAYPDSEAGKWARLGEARALSDLDRNDEARTAYETALRVSGQDVTVAWRALEGVGFSYEADRQWSEAAERYEELKRLSDGAFSDVADYHLARLRIAQGDNVAATASLRTVVEHIQATEEGVPPAFPYTLAQAEVRLRELDPSAAPAPRGGSPFGGGGLPPGLEGLEDMDPALREQILRQLAGQGQGGE